MNGAVLEPVRWSRQRWACTILAVFALQVGLVLFLGQRPRTPVPPPAFGTAIYSATDGLSAQQVANLATLQDPTLFVLPGYHSYSDNAWLSYTPLEHHLSDWTEPPRWLEFTPQHLGASFSWYAQTVTNAPLRVADLPLPPLTGSDLPVPNQPVGQEARVRIEGELARRPLREPLAVPAWPTADLLTNTVVHLAVDAEGFPLSTTLLAESGLPVADQFALQQAAIARFEPLRRTADTPNPDLRVTWGRMIFSWPMLMPAVTNTGPIPAP